MKNFIINIFVFFLLAGTAVPSFGQKDLTGETVKITKNDGSLVVGKLAQDDGREILLITEELGKIYIPKHEISRMDALKTEELRGGEYVGGERFASRHFLSSNALPNEKGDHYAVLNVYGPEIHFAVSSKLSVGVLTTWLASPLLGSAKYTFLSKSKIHASVGVMAGGLTFFGQGYGALGYGALTLGDRKANVSLSVGYAGIGDGEGGGSSTPLMSVAGMFKVNKKITLIGDSFVFTGGGGEDGGQNWALVMPGVRFSGKGRWGFQFGIGGIVAEGELLPVPIPNANIFLSLK